MTATVEGYGRLPLRVDKPAQLSAEVPKAGSRRPVVGLRVNPRLLIAVEVSAGDVEEVDRSLARRGDVDDPSRSRALEQAQQSMPQEDAGQLVDLDGQFVAIGAFLPLILNNAGIVHRTSSRGSLARIASAMRWTSAKVAKSAS